MKQIIPVIKDQGAVDRRPDVVRERRVGIAPLECVELPILEIAQSRCEALADQREQPEDMIAGASGVGEMLLDVEDRVLVKQPIEYVGRLAFSRADRQNVRIPTLSGRVFRPEAGHDSDVKPATIPINIRPL